ncbi:MAG TPA: hypothetical protein VKZ95_01035 [Sphingobacteriaceae bacterium]|nr:hypothetical protein [Sphingobacteriaceae bacterium]
METQQNNPFETPTTDSDVISDGKTIAIIAYITLIGLIIAFVLNTEKKNSFAIFHIRQSLGIGLTGLVLGMINIIPILGWFISIIGFIVLFVMWISGLISALNGKEKPVFLLGDKYQEWFKGI